MCMEVFLQKKKKTRRPKNWRSHFRRQIAGGKITGLAFLMVYASWGPTLSVLKRAFLKRLLLRSVCVCVLKRSVLRRVL